MTIELPRMDTPLVVGEPSWPSFDVLWEWAGDGELINRMEAGQPWD